MKYGEITHFNHPQHKLRFEYVEVPFKCDGCKEVGIGSRFKCALCDYDLHKHCALPSTGILYHPFYRKCAFQFLARPPGDAPRFCNACEKDVNGFVYHCRACGFDLHPCCANLPHTLDAGDGLRLYLYRKVGAPCHRCGRKGRSWSYRSTCKKYNLHVSCVMEMLVESWQEIYFGGGAYAGGAGGYAAGGFGSVARKVEGGYGGITKMNRIPSIRGTAQNRHRRKGKVKKCCELAGMAVQFIISARSLSHPPRRDGFKTPIKNPSFQSPSRSRSVSPLPFQKSSSNSTIIMQEERAAKTRRGRRVLAFAGAAALVAMGLNLLISALSDRRNRSNSHGKRKKKKKATDLTGFNVRINLSVPEIHKLVDHVISKSKETYDLIASIPLDKVTFANTISPLAELDANQFPLVQSCMFLKMVAISDDVRKASAEAERKLDSHFLICR